MATVVNLEQFMQEGFLVVRECVPPEELASLREHCELMVERHKKWWSRNRQPDEPPAGLWEIDRQPRVLFDRVVDRHDYQATEFLFHENTLGVSRQIMQCEEIVPTQFGMFCNPRRDHGPAEWHRDIRPSAHGNVQCFIDDYRFNPPHYTQWNIALYDDDVLWLVPRSHMRYNTERENRQLAHSLYEPLDGAIPVELSPGDAVVYLTPILHWGSNYSARLRRTMQFAYRGYNNGSFTQAYVLHWPDEVCERLPEHLAARFRRFVELRHREFDTIECMFRAMIAGEEAGFMAGLEVLHGRPEGRMSCLLQLSKIARAAREGRGIVGERFAAAERAALWRRFAAFDRALQLDEPNLVPGFQEREPTTYNFNEMPAMDVDEFVAGW
mgnify:CR=1 FL=1